MSEKFGFQPGYYEREPKQCQACGKDFTLCTPKGLNVLLYQEDTQRPAKFLSREKVKELNEEKNKYCPDCWNKITQKRAKQEKRKF